MTLGNNLIDKTTFNSRLQPTQIQLGTSGSASSVLQLGYTYGVLVGGTLDTTKNNGNIESQTVTVGASAIKQSYLYDPLNRLQSAAESFNQTPKWTQTYGFDRFGNRTSLANSGTDGGLLPTSSTPSVDAATNRINQTGFNYDNAGNLNQEPGKSYDYDAENRQVKFNSGAVTYSYDGDGHRVKKVVAGSPNVTTVFLYNVQGQLIAEYTDGNSSSGGGTSYLTTDHLGSTRVVTNAGGNVVGRHDYLPYGEEIPSQVGGRSGIGNYFAADGVRQKFTQKERDIESGLDYFGARYYSSAQGRFTSPDEFTGGPHEAFYVGELIAPDPILYAELTEPQSFNKYQYCLNNPLRYVDPDGHQTAAADALKAAWTTGAAAEAIPGGQVVGTVILVGAAVGTVGYVVYTNWDSIKSGVKSFLNYASEHGGKSAAQQDAEDGEIVRNGLKHTQQREGQGQEQSQEPSQEPSQQPKPQKTDTRSQKPKKDRSVEGATDHRQDMQKAQDTARRRGTPAKIRSIKRTKQEEKAALNRIKSSKDLKENQ